MNGKKRTGWFFRTSDGKAGVWMIRERTRQISKLADVAIQAIRPFKLTVIS